MNPTPRTERGAGAAAQPFAGVRVIDTSHVLAGPYCSYQLALLGADVIRIEPPTGGDIARRMGSDAELNRHELGLAFIAQNANKRSLAVDLKTDAGKDVLWRLLETADVFVENYRPGVMARLGFAAENVMTRRPDIIYASMTGFGQDGPLAARPAYDHVVQAFSGMMAVNRTPSGDAHRVGFAIVDYVTGLMGAFAVASALFQRTHTGQGQRIDVAMLDAAVAIMGPLVAEVASTGALSRPAGTRAFSGSPISGIFATAEGLLATTANTPAQARAMLRAIGLADRAEDPRLADWHSHPGLGDEFAPWLRDAFARMPAAHWEVVLAEAGVPAACVRDLATMLQHPHLAVREVVVQSPAVDGLERKLSVPGVGFRMAHGGQRIDRPPPRRGEHSAEILASVGYAPGQIDALVAAGVVGAGRVR